MVCIRCQKRPAIIFVQRMENGQMKNEGYCLHCAREMHIKPVDDLMKQFGMSDEDMDAMEDRMENMMQEMGDMSNMNPFSMMMGMGQPDQSEEDGDLVPGSSATFPLGVNGGAQNGKNEKKAGKNDKKPPRRKFLDTYCENLTRKAREGKLDDIIGRDREIYRTIQILSRRQKNNPCLIGEAGVGKTAIAEGIAERIAKGQVPAGLQDKEIFLLDLTSLVAGTQFRGQFEQRVKGLLSEVKAAGNVILFPAAPRPRSGTRRLRRARPAAACRTAAERQPDRWLPSKCAAFGKFADPLADKLLTTVAFIYMMRDGVCSPVVLCIILAREFAVSGLRMVAAGAKDGKVIAANMWGKVKTVLQMLSIIFYFFGTALCWNNAQ